MRPFLTALVWLVPTLGTPLSVLAQTAHSAVSGGVVVSPPNSSQPISEDTSQTCYSGRQYNYAADDIIAACKALLTQPNLDADSRAEIFNILGLVAVSAQRNEDGLQYYEQSLKAVPNYQYSLQNKGTLLVAMGRCPEALTLFDQALKLYPISTAAMFGMGDSLTCQGKYDEALEYLNRVVVEAPHVEGYYRSRARLLLQKGDYKKAIEDSDSAVRISPSDNNQLYQAALVAYGANDLPEAKKRVDQYLKATSNEVYGVLLNHLVQARAKTGGEELTRQTLARYGGKTGWLPSLLGYILGQVPEQTLLQASKSGDQTLLLGQGIDYEYYVGENLLLRGDRSGAEKHFVAATAEKRNRTYGEFWNALARLKQMKSGDRNL